MSKKLWKLIALKFARGFSLVGVSLIVPMGLYAPENPWWWVASIVPPVCVGWLAGQLTAANKVIAQYKELTGV